MLYLAIPLYPQTESSYNQVLTSFQNHLVALETGGEGVVLEGPGQVECDGATGSTSINYRIKSSGTHKVDADSIT